MAIYVMFKCCKCQSEKINSSLKIHLFTFLGSEENIYKNICEHFAVKYTCIINCGFFTIGWKITIEATSYCRNCGNKINFGPNTFNKKYYTYNDYHKCENCKTVLAYSVHGYDYLNDGRGMILQRKLLQEEKERLKKIQEEKMEKIRKQQKLEKMEEIIKRQKELNNELDKNIEEKCDINLINNEYQQLTMTIETTFSNNINFNALEEMNNLINFKMIKA